MPPSSKSKTLSPRDREILRDVIRTYVLTGEPVSSRVVAKLERHGLSSASIRNIMAGLEEAGFLIQPHTSAGRIPAPAGYHLYIESLMGNRTLPARERRLIEEHFRSAAGDGEQLTSLATHLLSDLSHQIAVVLTPAIGETVLKAIDFVPLSGSLVLCVLVSASGFVDNKVVETREPLPREELVRISNYLTDNFAGLTLRQVRERLLAMMTEEQAQMSLLLAHAVELARRALADAAGREVLVEGTAAVLAQPELADVERVRRLLDTFGDKARLLRILDQVLDGQGVRVVIGEDSDLTSELDFSLVATAYGVGERPLGTLGIFGPSRMEYERMIPLVHFLGETLSEALDRVFADGSERH